ncbi:uncharacterized protein IUM83_01945 [Phytophthora cinnamomi]|uniref:uncharacterized protein n=1 Tax=Phytophthora cinnamomi TaxID=4785 RepID=UPI0035596947|nr:hypothetical protein IUM83_01945 [Phytophthora cinnamomi]
MSVTRTFIPASRRALPDQDDVDMAEVESAEARSSRLASKRRMSKSRSEVKPERDPAHSESGLTSEGRQRSSLCSRRERASRNRSSRTSEFLRSGSWFSSVSSGAAQVSSNVMRQLHEQQAAFQARLNQAQPDMRLEVQRDLPSANQKVRAMREQMASAQEQKALAERTVAAKHFKLFEAKRRIHKAESRLACKPHIGTPETEDLEARIEEAVQRERDPAASRAAQRLAQQRELDKAELDQRCRST